MITDIVREVGGERVAVSGLMGPGVDPHLYKPTAGDVRLLEDADLIFYNGLHLEGRMSELFEKMAAGGTPTVAVTRDIQPARLRRSEQYPDQSDPHVWFDVRLWQEAVRTVAAELARLDPEGAATYQANAEAYLRELDELDAYVQERVESLPEASRVLVTAHDAFGYFGDRYGVQVRGLQGTSTAAEAGAADVQDLADFIAARRIRAIFVESSVPHRTIEAVRAAVQARGWDVALGGELFSDAMGDEGTPEGSYAGMVRHNVDTLVEALR
jgi:manganese/zinc/iron transport system substrate-binding protein